MAIVGILTIIFGLQLTTGVPETRPEPAGTKAGRPTLAVVAATPVTVAGRGFKPRERVRITAERRTKTVTASLRGRFKVVFPEANACNGFIADARGSKGSRATVSFASFANVHCLEP